MLPISAEYRGLVFKVLYESPLCPGIRQRTMLYQTENIKFYAPLKQRHPIKIQN